MYRVGVFEHEGKRGPKLTAYLRDFNPQWDGCCVHRISFSEVASGAQAKRLAMQQHREVCMAQEER